MTQPFIVCIVGAESTGKTTLAQALAGALARPDRKVALVDEYLREFCASHGRTPRRDEQQAIATQQTLLIAAAAESHDIVVADTSAVMVAVYSAFVFGDHGLHAQALQAHAAYGLTLLTALDLPWQPDGHQRDGAHVREPVDSLLRAALASAGIGHAVIAGKGPQRLDAALACVERALATPAPVTGRWHWVCERCGDTDCERHERDTARRTTLS